MPDLAADSVNQSVVDYADVADLYELCACRKEQTMRVCRSHEKLRLHRDSWMDIADQHCRNEAFYRGLLEQIASHLGPEVFVSDDGSVQDSPLMLKIPELVAVLVTRSTENWRTMG